MRGLSQSRKAEALRSAPLFEGLSKKELVELARVTDDVQVPEGTVLCREDTLGREFFVLVEGSVDVTREGKLIATRGGRRLRRRDRAPDVGTAHGDGDGKDPVRCLILMRGDFRRVLDENRSIERKVMEALAERVAATAADPAF